MFLDYHIHSDFSTDGKSSMEEMILKSIDLNLSEICFCDHVDYGVFTDDSFMVDLDKYFEKLNLLKSKYQDKITIKKGIEFGLQRHLTSYYQNRAKEYDFDFIICSIHAIDGQDLYLDSYFDGKTQIEIYENFYNEFFEVVKNYKDYNVLGHLDLIKRYSHFEGSSSDDYFYDIIESILKQVISDGKGIEINSSCFRYKLPDLTPSMKILKMYKDLGGEIITTGSDAHSTEYLACKFDYIHSVLKELGFKYVAGFNKRQPEFFKIDDILK
ncbi:MAG: histidinol-phosphatase HisJ family protein [Clostridioides sp.]|jgi:histidinol-phosphatase (PHP family)|nr:histidinol-phosphatase HisJ family protein [Clostridioides sp.]